MYFEGFDFMASGHRRVAACKAIGFFIPTNVIFR